VGASSTRPRSTPYAARAIASSLRLTVRKVTRPTLAGGRGMRSRFHALALV
jgi:hypothetical protein